MSEDAMLPGRPYLVKLGATTLGASLGQPKYVVDVNTLDHLAAKTLHLNEIGVCNLTLDRAGRVRCVRRQPRHGQLHRHRPLHQPHGRRRHAAFRAAPLAEHPLAGDSKSTRMRARARTAIARACCG